MTESTSRPAVGMQTAQTTRLGDAAETRRRRRPSGEPPPLPRDLRASGKILIGGVGCVVLLLILLMTIRSFGEIVTRAEIDALAWLARFRSDPVTRGMLAVDALGSDWTIGLLRWGTVLALVAFKRFRHLLVFLGTVLGVGAITSLLSLTFTRPRPLGVEILGHWEGGPFPSRPVAALAVTLIGITYSLVVPGKPRMIAKVASAVLILALGVAEIYLAAFHPIDVVVGMILGAAIPVVAFRWLTPNEVFPVAYGRGRAAHLDVGGRRGGAIRKALRDQLGMKVVDMKPFGLGGSAGSTPLLFTVEGDEENKLFGKLYASTHLRADRWYKLGRTLLYGRLEDETSFSSVRRLVQYEDHMLRVMEAAGVPTARPYGFVEITPEREYLLVTQFFGGAQELLDSDVDDAIIDDALLIVRRLWDNGIAHRDVKPSNLLVRDGRVWLIDVAFAELRPSPWRQAVDLANMMLVLALRSDAARVYERATRFFAPEEIAEAFAATHGVTIPSQTRSLMRASGRDLVEEFRGLAPDRAPIKIQRWSLRRLGVTAVALLVVLLLVLIAAGNLQGAGLLSDPEAAQVSLKLARPECERNPDVLALASQSVPTATLLPCLASLPLGWEYATLQATDRWARIVLDSDRAGEGALEVLLTRECEVSGATEVPTDEPGTRRYERIRLPGGRYAGSRYYVFKGGCVTYNFDFEGTGRTALAEEATVAMSFIPRRELSERAERFTGERLGPH